ncbi:MAG: transcription termination/antitermination protein NusA [Firmicutes bacterium]|nr:transcription termination/antitermination protein NusA [Bacillota bacterium]
MNKEFILAIEELEKERDISKDVMIKTLEQALVSACKKNYGKDQNVEVNIDRDTGDIEVILIKEVVSDEDVMNETQLTLDEAREIDPSYNIGDMVYIRTVPKDFGRIAAQTAKQVVVQFIREAERGSIYSDYANREGEIMTGVVQRENNGTVYISIDRTEGVLSEKEQVPGEDYSINSRLKVYIMDVRESRRGASRGPQILLSRSHPGLVKRLFELEVPEIREGVVEIRSIAREAGSRTKMAVSTNDPDVDAVGSCIGQRGVRVQAVVDELFGEKIDIISWSEDPAELIMSALSPAKAEEVFINEDDKAATVIVPDYQLSLAIGRDGQNVRLAARLCGWKIDIKSRTQFDEAGGLDAFLAEQGLDLVEEYIEEVPAEMPYDEAAADEAGANEDGIVFAADGDED